MPTVNAYTSHSTLAEVAALIRSASSIMLTAHAKPDGDALGSVLAMSRALKEDGQAVHSVLVGPLAPNLAAMTQPDEVTIVDSAESLSEPDLIILLDTGARSQVEPLDEWIVSRLDRTAILDHHSNGDLKASARVVEPRYASTTRLLIDLLDELDVDITGGPFSIAEALYLGLATDTGWFRFSNADADAFHAAARLISAGADKSRIYELVEENDRPARLAVLARALASVELCCGNRAAIMTVNHSDLEQTGATLDDMTGIVNEPMRIGSVRVSILLTELEEGRTKVSLRSKPPLTGVAEPPPVVDVNELAKEFGGGGHVRAAGARIDAGTAEAHRRITKALQRRLG